MTMNLLRTVPDNMFLSSESETSDTPNYILESNDDDIEEVNIPQVRLPLKNYSRDTEHPDDFEIIGSGFLKIRVHHMALSQACLR